MTRGQKAQEPVDSIGAADEQPVSAFGKTSKKRVLSEVSKFSKPWKPQPGHIKGVKGSR